MSGKRTHDSGEHMDARTFSDLQRRLQCRTVRPLLVPYNENTLDDVKRLRVKIHLDRCDPCRTELTEVAEMTDFFRANPPVPAEPSADLWTKLEAQIQSEATPSPIPAVRRPAPSTSTAQWVSFIRSFSQSGAVLAAVMVCGFFVLDKMGYHLHFRQGNENAAVVAALPPETITIRLPHITGNTHLKRVAAAPVMKKYKASLATSERRIARLDTGRKARSIVVAAITVQPAVHATTVERKPRMVAMADPLQSEFYDRISAPESRGLGYIDRVRDESPNSTAGHAFFAHSIQIKSVDSDKAEMVRPAVWMSDESETVTAESPVEAATAQQRQQTLFSYGVNRIR